MFIELPHKVRTATGATLNLIRELGRGGQGVVYEVAGGRHAVKLLQELTSEEAGDWAERLRAVRRLPLEGLPVARPIDILLPPFTGYVMDLLDGMVPLSRLISTPAGTRSVEHYRDTGGLRRRLRLLARVAEVLAALHARGLVYQDPSPSNVFISELIGRDHVWLIDTDNLSFASALGRPVHTARYSAPELRTGSIRRANSLSDAFAFAVIAYEVLTLQHPFIGDDLYHNEEEQGEASALDGSHPWIDHPDDQSNRSSLGIQPRALVLSAAVREKFRLAFVDGLLRRDRRPSVGTWSDTLRTAATSTVPCPACNMTYYLDGTTERCPWCDEATRPATLSVGVFVELTSVDLPATDGDNPQPSAPNRAELIAVQGEELYLTHGVVLGSVGDPDRLMFQLCWEGSRLKICNYAGRPVELMAPDAASTRRLEPGAVASIPAGPGPMWSVRIARDHRPSRSLRFTVYPGRRQ